MVVAHAYFPLLQATRSLKRFNLPSVRSLVTSDNPVYVVTDATTARRQTAVTRCQDPPGQNRPELPAASSKVSPTTAAAPAKATPATRPSASTTSCAPPRVASRSTAPAPATTSDRAPPVAARTLSSLLTTLPSPAASSRGKRAAVQPETSSDHLGSGPKRGSCGLRDGV